LQAKMSKSITGRKEVVWPVVWQVAQFASLLNLEGGSGLVFFGTWIGTHPFVRTSTRIGLCNYSLLLNPEPWEKHFWRIGL
jgi:hypothetical protein